jgi:hypothetical protein
MTIMTCLISSRTAMPSCPPKAAGMEPWAHADHMD